MSEFGVFLIGFTITLVVICITDIIIERSCAVK